MKGIQVFWVVMMSSFSAWKSRNYELYLVSCPKNDWERCFGRLQWICTEFSFCVLRECNLLYNIKTFGNEPNEGQILMKIWCVLRESEVSVKKAKNQRLLQDYFLHHFYFPRQYRFQSVRLCVSVCHTHKHKPIVSVCTSLCLSLSHTQTQACSFSLYFSVSLSVVHINISL